jgi:PKD repeat protein
VIELVVEEDIITPIAEAGLDIETSEGETVFFDASESTDNLGIVSYDWDFGDGFSDVGITVSHSYDDAGVFTVTLVVKDEAGNSDSDTLTVSVIQRIMFPNIDGVIDVNEYPHNVVHSSTGVHVYWYNDENDMYVGIVSPGFGWVALGFDPEFAMREANFIFGYVSEGETHVSDQYGVSSFTHTPDTDIGGTDDILEYAGSEVSGETIIEFRFPLDSGDSKDKPLNQGDSYTVLVAYSSSADNFTSKHTAKGSITISLD